MINWEYFEQLYIRPGKTDMRKAINGLVMIVEKEMRKNVFQSSAFLFCGRSKRNLKIIFWEKNGFWLLQKKLDQDKFAWPKDEAEALALTHEDLKLLLQGFDIKARHKELKFNSVS